MPFPKSNLEMLLSIRIQLCDKMYFRESVNKVTCKNKQKTILFS